MNRKVLAVVLFALLVVAAAAGWLWLRPASGDGSAAEGRAGAAKYHCPMHPTMVSDHPGDCPICGMRLVPMDEEPEEPAAAPAAAESPTPKKVIYRSTMNPAETSEVPAKDSMGMDMVPVEIEEISQASTVPGLSAVRIPARKQQLIGVKTEQVTRSRFLRTVRAIGRVTPDETRLRHVHTKIAGYVEKLYANATGAWVERGQPLLEIYSPELLASQQEFLVALEARARTAGSTLPSVAASGDELVASARRRLELFDLSDDQIREIESSGRARRTVALAAPISGTILARDVTEGERIEPGSTLLEIADLSRVWVLASVYEYEMPFVRVGQAATMTLSYVPGKSFEGRVSFIYPVLDAATRTIQLRLEFPNPRLELKPDMYAEVNLAADLGERLAVPASAVMDTGTRSVVFVDRGEGLFEPREVRIGLRLPDSFEVLEGLVEGETVLTSANFFIDAESKLKAALTALPSSPSTPEHRH